MNKPLKTLAHQLMLHIETSTPVFSGRGETALAVLVLPLTFIYKVLDSLYGKNAIAGQPWPYILLLSVFTAVAFSSIFWLATPTGARWMDRILEKNPPNGGQLRVTCLAATPPFFIGLFLLLLWLFNLPELHSHALKPISPAWSGLPLSVFLLLAGLALFTSMYWGLRLIRQHVQNRFGFYQLGCVLIACLPYFILQDYLPLLWGFTTPVAVTMMVYGTGLGRQYFNYSFSPRSYKETLLVLVLLLFGLIVFFTINLLLGSISYTGYLWKMPAYQIFEALFINLFVVGISEEIIFRSGLLTLVASLITAAHTPNFAPYQKPRTLSLLIISFIFGLVHIPHGLLFSFLAFWASLLYGLAYLIGKSLFGPVLLHGLLNVLLMMNFRLSSFQ